MGGGDGEGRGKADPAPDKAEATLGEGKQKMKLFKLDFGAERRELTMYTPIGKFYDVTCPFCEESNLVYYRNFARGVRCRNEECRAMLYMPTHTATKDMLPKNETVLVHDLRTSVGVAARAALEKAGGKE